MQGKKKMIVGLSLLLTLAMLLAGNTAIARTASQPYRVTMHNVDLSLKDSAFSPQNFTATVGQRITLQISNRDYANMDGHNIRLKAPDGTTVTTTTVAAPGETVTITFTPTQVGDYRFSCAIHCVVMGRMVGNYAGRITVTA